VVVVDGRIVAEAFNRTIVDRDPTAHAEIVALRRAAGVCGNHRLTGAVLVTTLEPCLMCVGAAVHARVATIVHGADDPKAGALAVLRAETAAGRLNHAIELVRGPSQDACGDLLREFFRERRSRRDPPEAAG
jgi:tRNA(adenine34) deaminase